MHIITNLLFTHFLDLTKKGSYWFWNCITRKLLRPLSKHDFKKMHVYRMLQKPLSESYMPLQALAPVIIHRRELFRGNKLYVSFPC